MTNLSAKGYLRAESQKLLRLARHLARTQPAQHVINSVLESLASRLARAEQGEKRWAGQEHRFHTRSGSGELNLGISHCKKAIQKASPGTETGKKLDSKKLAETPTPQTHQQCQRCRRHSLASPARSGAHHGTQLENQ